MLKRIITDMNFNIRFQVNVGMGTSTVHHKNDCSNINGYANRYFSYIMMEIPIPVNTKEAQLHQLNKLKSID
jgi:hypothetical protein